MKITIEISELSRNLAMRYVKDPDAQAASMYDHWAQLAQQKHPGSNLLTLPTIAEQEVHRERKAEIAAQEKSAFALQVDAMLATVPEQLRESVTAQTRELKQGNVTAEEAQSKIDEITARVQAEFERDAQRQSAVLEAAIQSNPALLDAIAARMLAKQGLK